MRRTLSLAALLLWPAAVHAQTLTVDVETTGSEPIRATLEAEVSIERGDEARAVERSALEAGEAPPVVVVVPPLEEPRATRPIVDARLAPPAPAPVAPAPPPVVAAPTVAAPTVPTSTVAAPTAAVTAPTPEEEDDDEEPRLALSVGLIVDALDLRGLDLDFHDPEIAALQGLRLSPNFAGRDALESHVVGGASIGVGMRSLGILRGPELRIQLGGGSQEGSAAQHPLLGAPDGLTAAITHSFFVRLETALGLEADLGPVLLYVVGRGAVGGIWIDMAVHDRALGRLGSETLDAALLELGAEAGIEIRLGDDLPRLSAAARGSFLGTPMWGGTLSLVMVEGG